MYENLRETMAREHVSMEEISKVLDVHRNSVSNKINGESQFWVSEAITIWRIFFKRYDFYWLFDKDPEQKSAS